MEATHIRFAKDLSAKLEIKDFDSYYSGTIYPDSRFITKIDRKLTHGQDNPTDPFISGLSDFEKGWAAHYLYDRLADPQYIKISPWPDKKPGHLDEAWQYMTSYKIIEDMYSYEKLGNDISLIYDLSCTPVRNENPVLLKHYYYDIQSKLYSETPTLDNYYKFWKDLNVEKKIIDQIFVYANEITNDNKKKTQVEAIYQTVLKKVKK